MKSDNLKESRNIEDRRGQSYPSLQATVTLAGAFYKFCYRLVASRVRSSSSFSWSF